jgi:hypothetical protein
MEDLETSTIELLFDLTAALTPSEQRALRDVLVESARTWSSSTLEAMSHTRDLHIADIADAQERGEMRTDRTAADLADAALGLYFSVLLFWDPSSGEPVSHRIEGTRELVRDLLRGPGPGADS